MDCPECNSEMEQTDTTYSNIKTIRAYIGQHTGDIYFCQKCETHYINDFLIGKLVGWSY